MVGEKNNNNGNTARGYVLKPIDDDIFGAFLRYHFLTSPLVCQLFYAYPGSLTWAQTKLKDLTEAGYLERIYLPRRSRAGSAPSLFTLARPGMQRLASLGHPVPSRARPQRTRTHGFLHLAHAVSVSTLLVNAELLARQHPAITVARMVHDLDLKRHPVTVADRDGTHTTVIPDGFLDLHLRGGDGRRYQASLCLEWDTGSEHGPRYRQRLRSWLQFAQGPYQQAFATPVLTIAVATPDATRCAQLVAWTEAELTALGVEDHAHFFLFTALDLETATPEEIYLAPRWSMPFNRQPVPLVEVPA
ncbi:MAG: replication-relaxation family protein [Dehalococcoidia bacterium]